MLNNDVMWLKICHFLQTNHCGRQTPDWPPMISMPCRVPTDVKSGQSFVINRVWQYWESIISKLDHRRHSVFYFGHLDQLLWGKPGTMLWRHPKTVKRVPHEEETTCNTNSPTFWVNYLGKGSSSPRQAFRYLQLQLQPQKRSGVRTVQPNCSWILDSQKLW